MTPLEFYVAVKNSDAKEGIDEMAQQIDRVKEKTNGLYEGPVGEFRMRTEIRGMIKDIAMGENPIMAVIGGLDRLSEMARWAGPLAAILALVTGIATAEGEAYTAAIKFADSYKKAMTGDLENSTLEQLKEIRRNLDEAEEKYKNRGWLERIMEGQAGTNAQNALQLRGLQVDQGIDDKTAAEIDARTAARKKDTEDQRSAEEEIAGVKQEYQDKINEANAAGQYMTAFAYQEAIDQAIEEIKDKQKKAADEVLHHAQEKTKQLGEDLARATAETLKASQADDTIDQMGARYNALATQIDNTPDGDEKIQLEIQQQEMLRELNEKIKSDKKEEAEEANKSAEAEKTAAEKTANLRKEAMKAQFEALDKEEKITVLKAEQLALEAALRTSDPHSDAALVMLKSLAEVKRDLRELQQHDSSLHGVDADKALQGSMGSMSWSRLVNDGANRAEKQRDDMVTLLKTIAAKDPTQISAY